MHKVIKSAVLSAFMVAIPFQEAAASEQAQTAPQSAATILANPLEDPRYLSMHEYYMAQYLLAATKMSKGIADLLGKPSDFIQQNTSKIIGNYTNTRDPFQNRVWDKTVALYLENYPRHHKRMGVLCDQPPRPKLVEQTQALLAQHEMGDVYTDDQVRTMLDNLRKRPNPRLLLIFRIMNTDGQNSHPDFDKDRAVCRTKNVHEAKLQPKN